MTLFIFPHKKERDLTLKALKGQGPFPGEPMLYPEGVYAFSGQGKVAMALAVQSLCYRYPEIKNILCLGTAGALSSQLKATEVVLGEFTLEYDFRVRARDVQAPKFPASAELLKPFPSNIPRGIIASGDEDVMSEERRQQLLKETNALCVAWEGAGAARAARHLGKKFLEIRGISDSAGSSVLQEFEQNLEDTMIALSAVMKYYIES